MLWMMLLGGYFASCSQAIYLSVICMEVHIVFGGPTQAVKCVTNLLNLLVVDMQE
jgi:uncharacterized membrane protein (DUF2068 family)